MNRQPVTFPWLIPIGVVISILASIGLVTTARGGELERKPWFVRVYTDDKLCDGGAVVLHIDPWVSEPLRIPLVSYRFNDAEWQLVTLEPGVYELHAQLVSCQGAPEQMATLEFEYDKRNRRKEIYIGLRSERELLNLDYFEIATAWDGSEFVSIATDGDDIVVTNISDVEIRECEFGIFVFEEYFADGRWDAFDRGGRRDWPERVNSLKPGKSLALVSNTIVVVKRYKAPPPKILQPSAKRYTISVQPQRQHFVTLSEPKWGPAGLPSCDRYYVETPTTEDDPPVKIWERD